MSRFNVGQKVVDLLNGKHYTVVKVLDKDSFSNQEYLCRELFGDNNEVVLKDYELVSFDDYQKLRSL
jgi:hypothetical protein